MFKIKATTIYTFIAPIFIFALAISFPGCKSSPLASTDLEFWGVFDDSDVFNKLIADFNGEFPKIKIKYYKKFIQHTKKIYLKQWLAGEVLIFL